MTSKSRDTSGSKVMQEKFEEIYREKFSDTANPSLEILKLKGFLTTKNDIKSQRPSFRGKNFTFDTGSNDPIDIFNNSANTILKIFEYKKNEKNFSKRTSSNPNNSLMVIIS